jgi:hypothetical protein
LPESVKDATYNRRKELMDQYVNFPTPFTLITGVFPYEETTSDGQSKRKIGFGEEYLLKEGVVTILDSGAVRISGSKGARGGFPDGKIPRYGYLFEGYFPSETAGPTKK